MVSLEVNDWVETPDVQLTEKLSYFHVDQSLAALIDQLVEES